MVENTLAFHDEVLLRHLVRCDVTAQLYAWPLLRTSFSEIASEDDWLVLWDNIFSNHPGFVVLLLVALLVECRVRAQPRAAFTYLREDAVASEPPASRLLFRRPFCCDASIART
jgi:hypothetical protein